MEEDMLHENRCKGDRVNGVKLKDNRESGKVAHRAEDILRGVAGGNGTWLPNINVDDGEGG